MEANRRQKHLAEGRKPILLTLGSLGLGFLALQGAGLVFLLRRVAADLPGGGEGLLEAIPTVAAVLLGVSALVLLPAQAYWVRRGRHRISGPVFAFEEHLKKVLQGRRPEPLKIRDGDEFHHLCELINQVTTSMLSDDAHATRIRLDEGDEPASLQDAA